MAIFKFIYKLMRVIGVIFIVVAISYIGTAIVYYSTNKEKDTIYPIEIIHSDKINCIDIYNKDNISINVEVEDSCSDETLASYALTYYECYQKEIYLYVLTQNKIVCVSKNQEVTILKK